MLCEEKLANQAIRAAGKQRAPKAPQPSAVTATRQLNAVQWVGMPGASQTCVQQQASAGEHQHQQVLASYL